MVLNLFMHTHEPHATTHVHVYTQQHTFVFVHTQCGVIKKFPYHLRSICVLFCVLFAWGLCWATVRFALGLRGASVQCTARLPFV